MTTVLNGTTVIYNRGGMTIDSLTAQGTSSSSATIVRNTSVTVVILSTTVSDNACNLPSGAEVGDVVEISVATPPNSGMVLTPAGESFTDNTFGVGIDVGGIFRKVSSGKWSKMVS